MVGRMITAITLAGLPPARTSRGAALSSTDTTAIPPREISATNRLSTPSSSAIATMGQQLAHRPAARTRGQLAAVATGAARAGTGRPRLSRSVEPV
jgi:hypothetical protein